MLITHFHLDHCAAVPFVVGRTNYGRILTPRAGDRRARDDFVKLNKQGDNSELFGEKDVQECMRRIEVIDFHREMDIDGVKVTPYRAGTSSALACSASVSADFACSTPGTTPEPPTGTYPARTSRRFRRTSSSSRPPTACRRTRRGRSEAPVHGHGPRVLTRGGKVLLPVVALGRAQEVL